MRTESSCSGRPIRSVDFVWTFFSSIGIGMLYSALLLLLQPAGSFLSVASLWSSVVSWEQK
jgi:hypothetical protein